MSDADSTLEVLIKSVSDATGYQMSIAEAGKLKEAVAKTSAASTVANELDAKATGEAIVSKRELRHIIGALGGEAVPELSRALSALAFGGGPLAAILLLVGAFEMVRKAIKDAKQADEDFNKAAANGDFAESLKAGLEVMRNIVDAADDYARKLEEIQRGEHGITAELTAQLKLIASIAAAKQTQTEAEKSLALEQVKEDEILGRITKSEADKRRGEIEKKAVADKARADEKRFGDEQRARAAELDKAAGQQAALDKAKDDAEAKLNHARIAQASAKGATEPTRDDVQKAQAEAQKALEVFQAEWEIPMDVDSPLPPGTSGRSQIDQATAKQKQVQADLLQRRFQQNQQANGVDVGLLEHDATAKQNAALENSKAIAKIRDEMNAANRDYTDPQVRNARSATENANLRKTDLSTAGELFGNAKKDLEEISHVGHSRNINPQDIERARDAVRDLSSALNQLPALLNDLKNLGTDAATLRAMQGQINDLKSRVGSPKN